MAENSILTSGVLVVWISTLALIVFYYRRLRAVSKEYSEARSTVEGIVTTFKTRYDKLSSALQELKAQTSTNQSTTREIVEATAQLNRRIDDTLATLEESKRLSGIMSNSISALQEEVSQLKKAQEALQSKVSSPLSLKSPMASPQPDAKKEDSTSSIDSKLTETENIVLQFLLSEGPKTAREVEVKIEKTREHTARLMKKLWQEGYVERETHKIPFTYRAARALRNLENPST